MSGSSIFQLGFMVAAYAFLPFTGPALAVAVGVAGVAGAMIGNALFPPKTNATTQSQKDLSIMTSTLGSVVPVIFGTVKLVANAMNFDEKFLKVEVLSEKVGKGGQTVETGRKYYLPYEQLICMGPINRLEQMYTSPGNIPQLTEPVVFFEGETVKQFGMAHDDGKGGVVVLYKGARQARSFFKDPYYSTGMNYNFKCWALMTGLDGGYGLGSSKTAPSYAWVVSRTPGRLLPSTGETSGSAGPGPGFPPPDDLDKRIGVVLSFTENTTWEVEDDDLSPSNISSSGVFFMDLKLQADQGGSCVYSGVMSSSLNFSRSTPLNTGLGNGCRVQVNIYLQSEDEDGNFPPDGQIGNSPLLGSISGVMTGLMEENNRPSSSGQKTLQVTKGRSYRTIATINQTGMEETKYVYGGAWYLKPDGTIDQPDEYDDTGGGSSSGFKYQTGLFPYEGDLEDYEIYPYGSYDIEHLHYKSANPAAILYECLTNEVWGLGRSDIEIDIKSFADASRFYAENNLGLSFALSELTTFKEVLKLVSDHVRCQIVYENDKIKLLNYLYKGENINNTPIISEDNAANIEIQSPTWQNVYNRVTADYTEPSRTYKIAQVDVRNEATQELQGGEERVQKIDFSGFLDRNIAIKMAERVLAEISKPTILAKCTINRDVGISFQVGDLVRLRWGQVAENGKVVIIPCRITSIKEGDSEDDSLTVELQENVDYARQVVGINETLEDSEGASDAFRMEDVPSADEYENTLNLATAYTNVLPMEPNTHIAETFGLTKKTMALIVDLVDNVTGTKPYRQVGPTGDPVELSEGPSEAYAGFGILQNDYNINYLDRSAEGILVTIPNGLHRTLALTRYTEVNNSSEHIEELLLSNSKWLVFINNELMKVGYIDVVDIPTNTYRLRNIIRGEFGTVIRNHAAGSKIAFIPELSSDFITQINDAVVGTEYYYRAYPVSLQNKVIVDETTYQPNYPIDSLYGSPTAYLNLQNRPSAPELAFTENLTSGTRKVWVRPRLTGQGAGYGSLDEMLSAEETNNVNIVYDEIRYVSGVPTYVKKNLKFGSYIPSVDGDNTTGLFKKESFTVSGTTTHIRIRAVKDSMYSAEFIELAVV